MLLLFVLFLLFVLIPFSGGGGGGLMVMFGVITTSRLLYRLYGTYRGETLFACALREWKMGKPTTGGGRSA
jgi:hypothetical protein